MCITMITLFIFMSSPLIMFFTHPILLAYLLVIYAFLISLFLGFISISWFLYLLVLIFLGGVMILIIYMTTMSANEKMYPLNQIFWGEGALFLLLTTMFYLMIFPMKKTEASESGINFTLTLMETSSSGMYVWITFYLLLVMISVVKIVKLEEGPLVKRL